MIEKLKKFTQAYVRFVQKILLFLLLSLLYIFGFGLTKIFAIIFRFKLFDTKSASSKTFWQTSKLNLDKNSFFNQV
jgi:uncharacterized membrane protein YesL